MDKVQKSISSRFIFFYSSTVFSFPNLKLETSFPSFSVNPSTFYVVAHDFDNLK
jgi:hypothetical protein